MKTFYLIDCGDWGFTLAAYEGGKLIKKSVFRYDPSDNNGGWLDFLYENKISKKSLTFEEAKNWGKIGNQKGFTQI